MLVQPVQCWYSRRNLELFFNFGDPGTYCVTFRLSHNRYFAPTAGGDPCLVYRCCPKSTERAMCAIWGGTGELATRPRSYSYVVSHMYHSYIRRRQSADITASFSPQDECPCHTARGMKQIVPPSNECSSISDAMWCTDQHLSPLSIHTLSYTLAAYGS